MEYYDGPAVVNLGWDTRTAAKEYDCTNCPEKILVGARYERIKLLVDGQFMMYRQHGNRCWLYWEHLDEGFQTSP